MPHLSQWAAKSLEDGGFLGSCSSSVRVRKPEKTGSDVGQGWRLQNQQRDSYILQQGVRADGQKAPAFPSHHFRAELPLKGAASSGQGPGPSGNSSQTHVHGPAQGHVSYLTPHQTKVTTKIAQCKSDLWSCQKGKDPRLKSCLTTASHFSLTVLPTPRVFRSFENR